MRGTLAKKGAHFPRVWAPRYCEVFASRRLLVYYHSEREMRDGLPPRGQRTLKGLAKVDDDEVGGSASPGPVLCLATAEGGRGSRGSESTRPSPGRGKLLLKFGSLKECAVWRHALAQLLEGGGAAAHGSAQVPGGACPREMPRSKSNSVSALI